MQTQKLFWEIEQNFNHIRLLCVEKYTCIADENRQEKAVIENVFRYCLAFLQYAKERYKEEILHEKYGQMIDPFAAEQEKEFAKKKANLTEAIQKGYGVFADFMTEAIDYPLFEDRALFGLWQKEENPYQSLQNIGKTDNIRKITLIDVAQIFREVLSELSSTSLLEDMNMVLERLKQKSGEFLFA